MPPALLTRLEHGAKVYGLPTQTFAKLILEMGLYMEQQEGLMVMGTKADIEAAVRHNRQSVLQAKKAAQKLPQQSDGGHQEAEATLSGGSSLRPLTSARTTEEELLADAGVGVAPEAPKNSEDDLQSILDAFPDGVP